MKIGTPSWWSPPQPPAGSKVPRPATIAPVAAAHAGVRRRFAPHQLRHAHALGSRARACLNVIQRQLGHANLGTTSIYLQGIDSEEIIATVHARRAPMSATAGLQL
jgi:site-specific recombinase XerD